MSSRDPMLDYDAWLDRGPGGPDDDDDDATEEYCIDCGGRHIEEGTCLDCLRADMDAQDKWMDSHD